ncbi:sigma-70 family RNA polymerase sigma factor [uncultured Friedmanniella sp.]|uniref:sigma-70 family RNA polymerase sigma factor n=1 Tax=uncultured Friedmanniella sp. TaxID=335381 RepID=UPI0035CBA037
MSDDEEFSDWAREHSPALLRRATLLCGDRHRAEDLVQETLVRLFLHWRRIDLDDNPVGYAHTTLFRLFVSGRRRRSSGELPTAELPERAGGPADVEGHLDLVAALQALSPKQRCVVVARYVDDRSVTEVARLMRRTESWVRVNASRALHQLRDSPLVAASATHDLARRS